MDIQLWQILVLAAYAALAQYDGLHFLVGLPKPAIAGLFAGLVMGDVTTGLLVGGTIQLMNLGVSNYGGASIPDYMSATLISTALTISTGQGVEFAVGIGVPAALLLVQLDILARMANTFFQHKAENYADKRDYKKVKLMNILGVIPWSLSRFVPVFVVLFFGADVVNKILAASPQWFLTGLQVAGGLLPAIGIAILLKYLPLKTYAPYLVIGFAFAAFLNLPVMGVALIGGAIAFIKFKEREEQASKELSSTQVSGGGFDEDE
ncbi:PTS mannose/fructose/sorbose/N-acetylgalactosamine transporter subunit IIC [Clostridium chrysemydis]|uniref:PTS mannose/fructose/sorbose/N-acetylgalactosamine transporter subunit IIC n=1 Tax=Clostridium chrysemydis TaxID=2665504 RepID=UPI0018846E7D|nr:PTS sugar transporter subunit IIC [Clostridium chrysemydis]